MSFAILSPSSNAEDWVRTHLGELCEPFGDWTASERFRGGRTAALSALESFKVRGYAATRNEVLPISSRGASQLSPYIRHGLLTLGEAWEHVSTAPTTTATNSETNCYGRNTRGTCTPESERTSLTRSVTSRQSGPTHKAGANGTHGCLDFALTELETDGWVPNQMRMWLASHWTVREGAHWQAGERKMYRQLLDGSYANRAGWQWTIGSATGRPYGFSRWQVAKRASALCDECPSRHSCPIEQWPDEPQLDDATHRVDLRKGQHPPHEPLFPTIDASRSPEAVWITAESLGDSDPALTAHPDLPALFIFDALLLRKLNLHPRRLVFLTECLADLALRREMLVGIGDPVELLRSRNIAVTAAPVPGFRSRSAQISPSAVYPWPWLAPISDAPLSSFSAWRRALPTSLATASLRRQQRQKRRH